MRRFGNVAAIAALALTPALASAQYRGQAQVPPGQRPANGMCRIWVDGVPPGRQPAPMKCSYAQSHLPPNARIIYGDGTSSANGSYDPYGTYGRNGGIFTSNGRIENGKRGQCVQRQDRYGRIQTVCADGDGDRDDRYVRAERDRIRQQELDERRWKQHKRDKHDDGDRDDDRRNDRRDDRRDARQDNRYQRNSTQRRPDRP